MIPQWVNDHKTIIGIGAALLLVAIVGRCVTRTPASPTKIEQKSTSETEAKAATSIAQTKDVKVTRKQAPTVREKLDPKTGAVVERTTTGEITTDKEVGTKTNVEVVERIITKTETIVKVETKPPPAIGIMLQPMWDRVQLRPSEVTVSVDFSVGEVLGAQIRAGPAVRWRDSAVPDAYGAVLRIEF